MPEPQQPELRRSQRGGTSDKDNPVIPQSRSGKKSSGRSHGTDKGNRGGGKGGGVPPGQQPPHPA
ncbi:hypothetical protein [Planomonospora venezuelensis]|uniref:Uncharacterized protein n=1 Tax=Planomonospora venezuelensis TaxID=1999 RepID=A0A841CZC8_PLAVE|nr:hypothetical protein [Planomonospora venezuelensis]MBB5961347.1 hypothetical protein [Planomonospora venezuelensis]GIN01911.1 hypothetical protein Pve01_35690 [Planomonospora venezuelensis]